MFEITEMTEEYAKEISGYHYPAPYDVYDLKGTEEEVAELMNGLHRAALYDGKLAGYVAFGWSAQPRCEASVQTYEDESYSDIALGLAPEYCGRGLGKDLLQAAVRYVKELFPEDGIRLTVRADNERAIRLYESAGFVKTQDFVYSDDALMYVMCLTEE